jgi:phage gp29-like protein
MNILNLFKKQKPDPEQSPVTKTRRISSTLKRNYQYRVELNLDNLKSAIDHARLVDVYNREMLYRIYDQVIKDAHLASQMRTALFNILQCDYQILRNGKPDQQATELLQTEWFDDFVELVVEAEFWGHSLIEFGQLNHEGQFDEVNLIPRLNVRQEFGIVVPEYHDIKGVDYRKAATRLALIEIGDYFNLGLLEIVAREVIIKNYARTDWSQASEKYGMPLLKILTESQDDKEIDRMEHMASNFASNGYVILNSEDDAEIVSPHSSDFHQIYEQHISLCDQQISKIINGQTGTSDEKAFVGSAEVHERILNDYTRSRLRRTQHIINRQLLPFLTHWGYPMQDCRIQYADLLPKPKTDNEDEDVEQQTTNNKQRTTLALSGAEGNNLQNSIKQNLQLALNDFFA